MESSAPPSDSPPAEHRLLRAIVDTVPDLIYVTDTAGRYLLANPAFARLAGAANPEALRGRTAHDFFREGEATLQHEADLSVIRSGQPLPDQEHAVAPREPAAGGEVWVSSTRVPLRGDHGEILGVISLGRDITRRRLADVERAAGEARLRTALSRLESLQQDLKAAQGAMIQAEKSEAVNRLVSAIAHEVKNPLSQVILGIDVLSTRFKEDGAAASVMDLIRGAAMRIDRIIVEMIELTTPGKIGLAACDVNAIIGRLLDLVQGDIRERRIMVEKRLAPELPPVLADGARLEQAFLHLLTNGIKAMDGGGTLTVTTRAKNFTASEREAGEKLGWFHAGDHAVEVEILDTGHGIPEDKLGKIFDPFFTTREPGQGMGLGLTVVQKILDLHQARLVIRNRPEGGVIATVTLTSAATP